MHTPVSFIQYTIYLEQQLQPFDAYEKSELANKSVKVVNSLIPIFPQAKLIHSSCFFSNGPYR
jgi:hypothetical protein